MNKVHTIRYENKQMTISKRKRFGFSFSLFTNRI